MKQFRICLLLLMTLTLSACLKTDWSEGTRLVTIEGNNDSRSWEETYTYNNEGKIEEINNYHSLGRKYEMEYKDGKLLQYRTYRIDNNEEIFRDSFSYDSDGRIKRIFKFSKNDGPNLPLADFYVFEYDTDGKVTEIRYYRAGEPEPWRKEVYHWKQNEIVQVDDYSDGELDHEWYYQYDNKKNYRKDIPIHWHNPLYWQAHNIVRLKVKDYTGLLDVICNPCETKYQYNLDGYPIKIETDWEREYELEYEEVD